MGIAPELLEVLKIWKQASQFSGQDDWIFASPVHADIRTTLNVYGDVVTDEMEQAHGKVVRLALSRT